MIQFRFWNREGSAIAPTSFICPSTNAMQYSLVMFQSPDSLWLLILLLFFQVVPSDSGCLDTDTFYANCYCCWRSYSIRPSALINTDTDTDAGTDLDTDNNNDHDIDVPADRNKTSAADDDEIDNNDNDIDVPDDRNKTSADDDDEIDTNDHYNDVSDDRHTTSATTPIDPVSIVRPTTTVTAANSPTTTPVATTATVPSNRVPTKALQRFSLFISNGRTGRALPLLLLLSDSWSYCLRSFVVDVYDRESLTIALSWYSSRFIRCCYRTRMALLLLLLLSESGGLVYSPGYLSNSESVPGPFSTINYNWGFQSFYFFLSTIIPFIT